MIPPTSRPVNRQGHIKAKRSSSYHKQSLIRSYNTRHRVSIHLQWTEGGGGAGKTLNAEAELQKAEFLENGLPIAWTAIESDLR